MNKICLLIALMFSTLNCYALFLHDHIEYELNNNTRTAKVKLCWEKFSQSDYSIPESVTFDDIKYTVTSIGDNAFEKNTILTDITIPKTVTTIGNNAFKDCTNLTNVNLPNTINSIGDYAFAFCSQLVSINIPNTVIHIGQYAFQYCIALKSINIPECLTDIEDGTFLWCKSLTSVTIPNSIIIIGQNAFAWCTHLESVVIPRYVTTIKYGAFNNCNELKSVYTLIDDPSSSIFKVFSYENRNFTILYVKKGLKSEYQKSWGFYFSTIIEISDEEYKDLFNATTNIKNINTNNNICISTTEGNIVINTTCETQPIYVYNISGKLIKTTFTNGYKTTLSLENKGIYVVKIGNNIFKVQL